MPISVSDTLKTLCLPMIFTNPLVERHSREQETAAWVNQVALGKNVGASPTSIDEVRQVLYILPSAADRAMILRPLLRVPRDGSESETDSETRSSVAQFSESNDWRADAYDGDDERSSSSEVEEGQSGSSETAFQGSSGRSDGGDVPFQANIFALPARRECTTLPGWGGRPIVTEGPNFELYMKLWDRAAAEEAYMGDPWKQSVFVRMNMKWQTEGAVRASAEDYTSGYETEWTHTGGPALSAKSETPSLGRPWEL